jgi:hypothetical protein
MRAICKKKKKNQPTNQRRYVLRRQQLLAEGVDPADLNVFGAALTRDLSPSKRMTNAAVAVRVPRVPYLIFVFLSSPDTRARGQSYKAQFLLAQQQRLHTQEKRKATSASAGKPEIRTSLTREESLMSIADAICPPGLRPETVTVTELPGDHSHATATRRGHSVSRVVSPADGIKFLGPPPPRL